jgi:hypothetical protein
MVHWGAFWVFSKEAFPTSQARLAEHEFDLRPPWELVQFAFTLSICAMSGIAWVLALTVFEHHQYATLAISVSVTVCGLSMLVGASSSLSKGRRKDAFEILMTSLIEMAFGLTLAQKARHANFLVFLMGFTTLVSAAIGAYAVWQDASLLFQSFPMASGLFTAFALFNMIRRRYTLWSATRFISVDAVRYADVWDAIVRDSDNQRALEEISRLVNHHGRRCEDERCFVINVNGHCGVRNNEHQLSCRCATNQCDKIADHHDGDGESSCGAWLRWVMMSFNKVSDQQTFDMPLRHGSMMPAATSLWGTLARRSSSGSDSDVGTVNGHQHNNHITTGTLLRQCNRVEECVVMHAHACVMSRKPFADVTRTRSGFMAIRGLCRYEMDTLQLQRELVGVRGMVCMYVCVCVCVCVCLWFHGDSRPL